MPQMIGGKSSNIAEKREGEETQSVISDSVTIRKRACVHVSIEGGSIFTRTKKCYECLKKDSLRVFKYTRGRFYKLCPPYSRPTPNFCASKKLLKSWA